MSAVGCRRTSGDAESAHRAGWLEWTLAMLVAVPSLPPLLCVLAHGLDESMFFLFSAAELYELSWGTDFRYAWGPLAFLSWPLAVADNATLWFAAVVRVGVVLLLYGLLFDFLRRTVAARWQRWVVYLIVGRLFLTSGKPYPALFDSLWFATMAVAAVHCLCFRPVGTARALLVGAIAGALLMFKFGTGVVATGLLGFVVLRELAARQWRPPVLASAAPAATLAVVWLVFSGPASSFHGYLQDSREFMAHYGEVAIVDSEELLIGALALAGSVAAVLAACAVVAIRRRAWGLVWVELAVAAAAFYHFKHAIVRCDGGHTTDTVHLGACVALGIAPLVRETGRGGRLLVGAVAGYAALLYALLAWGGAPIDAHPVRQLWQRPRDLAVQAWAMTRLDEYRSGDLERFVFGERALDPELVAAMPAGTVDIYPCEVTQLFVQPALATRWQRRPIFQSHATFSPVLDRHNERALRERGPDFVVFGSWVIDGRYRLSEEPLSLDAMRALYRPVMRRDPYLLLARGDPRQIVREPLGASERAWGEWIEVPEGQDVYLAVEARRSLLGRIGPTIYRDGGWHLEMTSAAPGGGGEVARYRVVTSNLRSGIYIARRVETLEEFERWFGGGDLEALPRVHSVRLVAGYESYFAPRFTARFERRSLR